MRSDGGESEKASRVEKQQYPLRGGKEERMSQEALVRFYKAMFTDEKIEQQAQESLASNNAEKLVEIVQANGYDFTLAELHEFTRVDHGLLYRGSGLFDQKRSERMIVLCRLIP